MRYLLLLAEADHFAKWSTADEAQRDRVVADFRAFDEAARARGAILAGEALSDPGTARTVRPGEARPVTEGPFAETVEQLGGFYLLQMPDLDTAVEVAALLPREYDVEVRECLDVEL